MNLYIYIPPHLAHMCGMMRGIVYGELKRTLNNYYTAEFRSSSNAIVGSMNSCVYIYMGR